MSILIDKNSRVMTQGITGKTGQFHTRGCRDYANGKNCFVAGVNPKKAGEDFEGIPIYGTAADAKKATGATVSVIYVPPPFAAAAIEEAVDADLDLVICITEGIPVLDMVRVKRYLSGKPGVRLIGPNCPGVITPGGKCKIGIMRCDVIAEGVVAAAREVSLHVPLVVRLEGTNVSLGKKILAESGLAIIPADNLADAAQKVVAAVKKVA